MKATALLEKQHRKVESIFQKLEKGRGEVGELVTELANDLAAHMVIEQEIFYPAAKAVEADLVLESYEEHALAAHGLRRLLATDPEDESFQAKVTALKELIQHHVEEEESDLFPSCEKVLGAETLDELGKEMKSRFDEVVEAGYAKALDRQKKIDSPEIAESRGNSH